MHTIISVTDLYHVSIISVIDLARQVDINFAKRVRGVNGYWKTLIYRELLLNDNCIVIVSNEYTHIAINRKCIEIINQRFQTYLQILNQWNCKEDEKA